MSTPRALQVSASAHLIGPQHRTIDKVAERFLGNAKLGTTGRGIGPTYADKMSRVGVRVQDLFDEKILRQKVEGSLELKNHLLVKVYNRRAITVDEVVEEFLSYAERLRPMVVDTSLVLGQALDRGETVLLEGGQATLLDVDHGTYPFVTSSNPTAGGACTGSGIPPTRIDRVIAVVKAYATRVGSGPFPTELHDADGERLRADGAEFGTTTGRPRRCGWYDAAVARYAARVNGVTDFVLTKLDVLTGWERIPVCVALRRRRRPARRDADDPDRLPPCPSRSTSSSTAGRRTSPVPGRSTTCPRRRSSTCARWRRCPARRSRRSGSGRAATRPSRSARCWADVVTRQR